MSIKLPSTIVSFFEPFIPVLRTMDRRLALAASSTSTNGDNLTDTTSAATSTSMLLLEKDVFVCSELERASSCLASVDGSLATLLHHINTSVSATGITILAHVEFCHPQQMLP